MGSGVPLVSPPGVAAPERLPGLLGAEAGPATFLLWGLAVSPC